MKKITFLTIILAIIVVVGIGAVLWGPIMSNVEEPKYTVVEKHDAIELRDYPPMLVAQAQVNGEREVAINEGFRKIADFIFGNNQPAQNVAMTAPVLQQQKETIAMTAPVLQQAQNEEQKKWEVRFVMPAHYTLDKLPKPNNPEVLIKEEPEKRFAVIRFSGTADTASLEKEQKILEAFLMDRKLSRIAPLHYAFYNPPWTLPFLRRNEIWAEIKH